MKSKLLSCKPDLDREGLQKSWTGKESGIRYYNFVLEFENGTKGIASSTKTEPYWNKTGREYSFVVEKKPNFPDKIKDIRDDNKEKYDKPDFINNRNPYNNEIDIYIARQVAYEQATKTFMNLDMTQFEDVAKVKLGIESLSNKYLNYLTSSGIENVTLSKQQRIIKQNVLKRAIEQMDIPILMIKNSDMIIERAREIEKYILNKVS